MSVYRLNHSFTAGELSPMMHARKDFDRYKNGCSVLENMVCATQGPAVRRPGTQFIYDLVGLGMDVDDPQLREIPFIFNEDQSYAMIFFMHTDGSPRMVLGNGTGLVVGSGDTYTYDETHTVDYLGASLAQEAFTYTGDAENSEVVTHEDLDGVETVLTLTTDYTVDYTAGVCTVTTTATAPALIDGDVLHVAINMTTVAILATSVVELVLPATFLIEEMDWAQSADEMHLVQSAYVPTVIVRYDHDIWKLVTKSFTDMPSDWSDTNGWPERVTFHQQRLLYGANILRRQTIWGSEAGNFVGFTAGTNADDAFTFTLDSGTQNRIQWMLSSKSLHVGTLGDEWTVTGATQSALTPTNILAQRQTNNGSEDNKPLMVGLTTLFVERHGRTIDEFVYDYTYDSYKTSDLAILSPHVTELYSITDWAYQQTPDSVIWAVRSDGVLLGLTYQRQHKVVGWHRHTTDGEFKTITVIPGDTREDDVWTVVKRTVAGTVGYFVEKFTEGFKSENAVDARFLDSQIVYDSTATDTIDGLDHLTGLKVDVLADGTVHPAVVVDSSGEITLNNDYSVVVAGLPFVSEVRPLLSDVPSQNGTAMGRLQRIMDINVDLYNSLGMQLGTYRVEDGESVEDIPFRVPTDLTGQAVPLFTGIKHLSFPEGVDRDTVYFIRQTQPLPLTVRGVTDEVEVFE